MQSVKRALAIAVNWSPVTGTAGPSACSSAALTSTTETLLMANVDLWVSFGIVFNHFVELQLFLCNQVTGLALIFSFWTTS